MSRTRCALFDVDGTLTSFDPDDMTDKDFNAVHPSKSVIDAFGRLRNAGHRAFICTGRPLWLIADGLRALNPAGIVAMAGATLEVEGRVVHEDCFDEDIVEELAHRVVDAGIEVFSSPMLRPLRWSLWALSARL